MSDQVDIRSLYQLPMENLEGLQNLSPEEINQRFRGSDLLYDKSTGVLKRISTDEDGKTVVKETSLFREAQTVALLRQADADSDGYLEPDEARTFLKNEMGVGTSGNRVLYPGKFLEGVQKLMDARYHPIAGNIKRLDGAGASEPILTLLKTYNAGLLQDDVRHAHAVLPVNGLTKSAANIVLFVPSAIHNIFTDDQNDAPMLMGTALAQTEAQNRFNRAERAIANLRQVFLAGVEAGEAWAMTGDLDKALEKLEASDREIITDQLAGKKIYQILKTESPQERFALLEEFAAGERPGFLGFGGGNTSDASFWNYLGWKRNTYMALSIQHYLVKKASTEDVEMDEARRTRARDTIQDIKGEGGGFTNLFMVGLTNVFSLGGTFFEPTPYREWGDTAEMNGVGRFANGAFAIWGGNKLIQGTSEALAVRRMHGLTGLSKTWWKNARLWKPLPVAALRTAAKTEDLGYSLTQADRIINGAAAVVKWPFQKLFFPITWLGGKIKRALPGLSKSDEATEAAMNLHQRKPMGKLVRGVLLVGIMQYADEKITGPVSPFEMGFNESEQRTLDANPPRRLQDFDPLAYPGGVPKLKPERL